MGKVYSRKHHPAKRKRSKREDCKLLKINNADPRQRAVGGEIHGLALVSAARLRAVTRQKTQRNLSSSASLRDGGFVRVY